METDIERILIHRDQIQRRVHSLAQEVAAVYERSSSGLTLVPILAGSIIFLADLIRELPLKMKVALAQVSTYPGRAVSAQRPRVVMDVNGDIAGREVLIVDDILDSGNTLRAVQALVRARQPVSLRTAVLLRKTEKAPADVPVDFVGFDIENLFIVGYGLDYDDHYRNYPHIGVLRRELMS